MTANKVGFDLSFLSDFISEILSSTESVKNILERECNEARYVLRTCTIEMIITREIDEDCCTCDSKGPLENHAKEIVDGIGRALAQAQELREKIAMNVSKQKRKMREPDLETCYKTDKKILPNKTKCPGEQIKTAEFPEVEGKLLVARKTNKSSDDTSKETSVEGKKLTAVARDKKPAEFKSKTVTERKLLHLSAGSGIGWGNTDRVKTTKNFLAANKSNLKNFKRTPKSTVDQSRGFPAILTKQRSSDLSPLSGTSEALSGCTASIAELNDLMTKVSVEATKSTLTCDGAVSMEPDCPCHGADRERKIVKQRVRSTIDLMEGLDRYGVPAYIVRLLKIYHCYTSREFSMDDNNTEKRCQKAADRFLAEFDEMNEDRMAKRKITYPTLGDLTVGFKSLFRELYGRSSDLADDRIVAEITSRYSELDYRSKVCQLQKFDPTKFRKSKTSSKTRKDRTGHRGWSANGVWNRADPDSFPAMTRIHCMRYANRDQLSLFFELNQRLQLLIYQRNFTNFLTNKVLPYILENFHNTSSEYCDSYKMIFTIAQVINPRITTLVRTDV